VAGLSVDYSGPLLRVYSNDARPALIIVENEKMKPAMKALAN
jgi:hypothetical protein